MTTDQYRMALSDQYVFSCVIASQPKLDSTKNDWIMLFSEQAHEIKLQIQAVEAEISTIEREMRRKHCV